MTIKKHDIIIYGATSFVGQILTRYMKEQFSDGSVNWAVAGRSESKLQALIDETGLSGVETILANSNDETSLQNMCAQGRVIISTVGPYALYGDNLVKVCAETGTHYCDLTGEAQWIRKMQDAHEATAKESGARIVHCCGFDSIPSDLGVHFLQKTSKKRFGKTCNRVNMRVVKMKGGASGGTIASIINMIKEAASDADLRRQLKDPYSICPSDHKFTARQRNVGVGYDEAYGAWIGPFIMEAINSRVVHRSNALSGNNYGEDFLYEEAMVTGKAGKGKRRARATAWGMNAFMVGLAVPPMRWLLENHILPKPGEGPSKKEQLEGEYDLVFMGTTEDGDTIRTRVTGDRDPGYGSTAKMLAQSAVCLAQDIAKSKKGGFWTPASLMGDKLIKRLEKDAGLTFEIE